MVIGPGCLRSVFHRMNLQSQRVTKTWLRRSTLVVIMMSLDFLQCSSIFKIIDPLVSSLAEASSDFI